MQVSVEATSGLGRRLTIDVPASEVDSKVEKRLQEAQKSVRMDGFRPGKVPLSLIKKRYQAGVRNEVLADVMREAYLEAITKEKIEPAGLPGFEAVVNEAGKDLQFAANIEVFPEIALGDFSAIKVERQNADIQATDVDAVIEKLRQQRGQWVDVERAAAKDDNVTIDFLGRKDGEEFEGGAANDQQLLLGSGAMIPGFEDGIVGHKAGEEFVIPVTFPEDYHAEQLKGQAVEFTITLKKVQEKSLPAVDEEFMKAFGVEGGDQEKFRAEIEKNMQRELKNALEGKTKKAVMDGLLAVHEFDLPKALVDGEVSRMRQQMFQQFGGGQQFDPNMLPADLFTEQAERSVRLGLIVREIVSQNNLEADQDAVKARIEDIASQYEDKDDVVKFFMENAQQRQQIEGLVLEQQVVDTILAKAVVTDVTVDYEKATAQATDA